MITQTAETFPWLQSLYDRLLLLDIEAQLPGTSTGQFQVEPLSEAEIRKLMIAASALALEDHSEFKSKAYEICSRLVELYDHSLPEVIQGADFIFSRLGNFPGRSHLRKNFSDTPASAPTTTARLAIERLAREIENTVELQNGSSAYLTDFQFRLFEELEKNSSFSVSAPTSAGKSYVLGLDLIRRLSKTHSSIVYLVPTRALISEVSQWVRESLRRSGQQGVAVRTVPFPVSRIAAPAGVVYVLTQERLMSLLSSGDDFWITSLIVDEAHNIQDDARGVLLQLAIERVAKNFPDADIHFASPLSANPEIFLKIINRETVGRSLIETVSPVSQNIILVNSVNGNPKAVRVSLLTNDGEKSLGERELSFKLRGGKNKQKADFARSITSANEATIIFCNGAEAAESVAEELVKSRAGLASLSQAVVDLIDFIKSDIHPNYRLIDCLPCGVAYHYGNMPPLVRSKIEDLFKAGEVQFLCCTSTLLQGVNLPARHIVIDNPYKGQGKPMPRRDFLNLAGRAGRLLKEFHGNVWCVRPLDWDERSFQGENLVHIHSAIDSAMADGGVIVQNVMKNPEATPEKGADLGDAIFGKLFLEYSQIKNTSFMERWLSAENKESLETTKELISGAKIDLPQEILESNGGIRPDRLQALYNFIIQSDDVRALSPLSPWAPGYYEQMKSTIKCLEMILHEKNNESYIYLTWLASQWIHGKSIKEILSGRLMDTADQAEVSRRIRAILRSLEKDIRFRMVKFYTAYISLVQHALRSSGFVKEAEVVEPFHVYLECGSADKSVLNLIALGLSRSTSIALSNALKFGNSTSPEEILQQLRRISMHRLSIPELCKREILDLVEA